MTVKDDCKARGRKQLDLRSYRLPTHAVALRNTIKVSQSVKFFKGSETRHLSNENHRCYSRPSRSLTYDY